MSHDVAVLGVGMHPWGKWGRSFVEYGVTAAEAALADAGVDWNDVEFVVGGETVRNGYGGYVAGSTFARALGWNGARVATCYAACASGSAAIEVARTRILAGLCNVALVVGADTTPKGFLAPNSGERWDDPDWLRFRLIGATNPTYFGLYARRRMDLYGSTTEDFAAVKVKNAAHGLLNENARFRKAVTLEEVRDSPVVADPLRLLDICATSDGGAAVVLTSMEFARRKTPRSRSHQGGVDGDAAVSEHRAGHARHHDRLHGRGACSRGEFSSLHRAGRLRRSGDRSRRSECGRGLRPLDGPGARLVRRHRPVQAGRC
jgi:acetyl-CoA acetyltransferase